MLDVTATDSQGVQVFGESKTFNMIGYTGRHRQGETTVDNWLIRSWDDRALQPGLTAHVFEFPLPADVRDLELEAKLTYQVGDVLHPMSRATGTLR